MLAVFQFHCIARATNWWDQSCDVAHAGYLATFDDMSKLWRADDNTVFHITCPRCENQTSSSKDERVTWQS